MKSNKFLWTDGRMDGQADIETGFNFITSTWRSRANNVNSYFSLQVSLHVC